MGLTIGILVILVVVEVALTAYSLSTRSNQTRVRSWARIGMLAAFALATLASIIHWSLIWYLLAALLVLWAARGAWALSGRRPEQAFSTWRSVRGAIGRLLLVLIVLTPAILIPQFTLPRPTGPYQVSTVIFTFTDTSRVETFTDTGEYRKVNVGCWYPQGASGKFPLVVFSHGAFGTRAGNASTFMNLASNGYVACSVDHPYHSLFTRGADGRTTTVNPGYFRQVFGWEKDESADTSPFAMVWSWLALRTDDMQFALNSLEEQARRPDAEEVYQRMDLEHIGLFGHSLGGATSTQLGRERDDIDAVIVLDGDLKGEYLDYVDGKVVINESIYPIPILFVETDAMMRLIKAHEEEGIPTPTRHILATAPHAYERYIQGNHMNVTDLPLISPVLTSLIMIASPGDSGASVDGYAAIAQTNQLVLEFFDVYLKGQGSFSAAGTP